MVKKSKLLSKKDKEIIENKKDKEKDKEINENKKDKEKDKEINENEKDKEKDKEINENENEAFQSRIDKLQEEFGMSDIEIDEIRNFISTLPRYIYMSEIIEELVRCDDLDVRQKVIFAHTLGIFRTEKSLVGNSSRTEIKEIAEFKK